MSEKGIIEFTGTFDVRKESPIDPRTRQETFADLLLASTWTQGDGLLYRPNGLTVLVYDDTEAMNGYYFLPKDAAYSVADNWVKVASGDGFKVLDITNISELDTMSLEQGIYLVRGAVYGQLTVIDIDAEVSYTGELSGFTCTKGEVFYTGELSSFACVKALPLNLITSSFETHAVTVHSSHPVASPVTVGVQLNDIPSMFYITIPSGSSSNVLDPEITVTSAEIFSVDPEFDSEYDYYFATLE